MCPFSSDLDWRDDPLTTIDKLWRKSCAIFGEPELGDDPEINTMAKRIHEATYQRRVRPIIEHWFVNRTKAELEWAPRHNWGQHNREVYVDWLGIKPERFEALRSAGVI